MTDEEKIIARILDVIPPRSFELTTFLTLFRVRFSEKTKTACVTCGESPELLLNKEFIEAHCQTNEHLFMLVMHELYHVILGHTTLFPRATEVRNLVFDAVINAILCSLFPMPEFTSFFTDYYPSDKMPFALLRPKGEGTPLVAESALKLLYGGSDTGTYHDVYEALLKSGCVKEMIVLLGGGASGGRTLPRGIRRLMRRAAIPGKKEVCRRSVREMVCETATFLPDWHDRSHEAREVAFGDSLIYSTTTRLQRPSSRDNRQAFVYFDVSGSVAEQVPSVAQALLPYCRCGLCTVHVFATVVHPASARDLASRKFSSTGGTDIDCVLKHVLELPPRKRPRAAVVVTDGFTGAPDATLAARFRAAGMRLFVGLVKSDCACNQESNLSSLADKFIRLY